MAIMVTSSQLPLKNLAVVIACLISICTAQLPTISLQWGNYTASTYDSINNIYTWRNVRFGHNTSETRFQASKYPARNFNDTSSSGQACPQVDTKGAQCIDNSNGTFLPYNRTSGEDCLFLDLYVPQSAILNAANRIYNTPVVVWIYGGAFVFGSKDTSLGGPYNNPLYNGTGPLVAAQGDVILVTGNYRLGAFGWLAGPTMESQGYPNAGLSDQRLLFQWVQDFIYQVGGNKQLVSAWGESAGASSILHHLISRDPSTGGLMPSYFTKAAIQSPAYEWQWDPQTLNSTYNNFTKLANCPNCSVSDLQKRSYAELAQANQDLYQSPIGSPCTGLFPLGPSIDNQVITQLTPVALNGTQGVDFQRLDSIIVSHVTNEAWNFIPGYMRGENKPGEAQFQKFLNDFIPEQSLKPLLPTISNQYALSKFQNNQTLRVAATIQDAVFVCNTRHLFDAYTNSKTTYYAMSYDFLDLSSIFNGNQDDDLALHASDVPAIFWNHWWNASGYIYEQLPAQYSWISYSTIDNITASWNLTIAEPYQTYWTAHAIFGNPNIGKAPPIYWNPASVTSVGGDLLISNTLQPYTPSFGNWAGWQLVNDTQNGWNNCSFWRDMAFKVEDILNGTKPSDEFIELKQQKYDDDSVLEFIALKEQKSYGDNALEVMEVKEQKYGNNGEL